MDQSQWIEITGTATAAYLRDVVLPGCERRAAQQQVLAGSPRDHSRCASLPGRRLGRWQQAAKRLLSRTPTLQLPHA